MKAVQTGKLYVLSLGKIHLYRLLGANGIFLIVLEGSWPMLTSMITVPLKSITETLSRRILTKSMKEFTQPCLPYLNVQEKQLGLNGGTFENIIVSLVTEAMTCHL